METQDYSLIFDLDNGWVTVGGIRSVFINFVTREWGTGKRGNSDAASGDQN